MRPKNINLHIEELVLHGFAPGDRHRIGDAVERELRRLLIEQGVPASLTREGSSDRIDAGSFDFAPGTKAETIGVHVAKVLYSGFRR
jgi:hypothetical protein